MEFFWVLAEFPKKFKEMMVQSKIKVKENDENGVASSKRRCTTEVDHWAFLEEFEAPMWADLTLEPKLISEDNDDAWFHTSHPFHHHSARHLRSVFAHPDMGNNLFNFCSPNFPSSVSKSRGKDYRSKDWYGNCCQISSNKNHPVNDLGGRLSITKTVSSQECKPKVSHEHQSEASSLITSLENDSERRVALNSQSSTSGVLTSTITTVSMRRDSKVLEVSKETFGHTGGLLNALRTNLRKSRAIRPALRVEISDDRESNNWKSSTGKSSVGSSSTGCDTKGKGFAEVPKTDRCKQLKVQMNLGIGSKGHKTLFGRPNQELSNPKFEVKKMAAACKQNKDRNPNNREIGKLARPVNERIKAKKISEASVCTRNTYSSKIKGNVSAASSSRQASVCARNTYSSKIKGKDAAAASSGQAASKLKVVLQTTQKNTLNRSRTGAQGVKGKVGSSQFLRVASNGKENVRGRAVLSHISGGRDREPVVRVSDQKVPKLKSKKVGVASSGSKVRIGKTNEGTKSLDSWVHIR